MPVIQLLILVPVFFVTSCVSFVTGSTSVITVPVMFQFGIDPRDAEDNGLRAPLAMGGSFALGSFVPIFAFLMPFSMHVSTVMALIFAVIALFAVGYYAGTLSNRHPVAKGFEIVAFGFAVFAVSFLAAHFIPPLFGHAPVSSGG